MTTLFLSGFQASDFQTNQNSGNSTQYIKPGTASICNVSVGYAESVQKKTPAIEIHFKNEAGEVNTETLYITEGGFNITKQFVARLADNAGLKDALVAGTNSAFKTAQDWVTAIANVLNGANVGVAFKGKEYVNSQSEVKTKAIFWYSFAATPEAVEAAKKYIADHPEKAVEKLPTQATATDFSAAPFDVNKVDPFATNPFVASGTPPVVNLATGDGMVRDAQGNVLF